MFGKRCYSVPDQGRADEGAIAGRERRHESQAARRIIETRACSWWNVVFTRPTAVLISHAEKDTPQNNKFSGAAPLLGSVASKPRLQVLKKES